MTLSEFRKLFVDLSGRFDLVKDTEKYEDQGANFFIQSGQRMLDSMFTHSKSYGFISVDLKKGQSIYPAPNLLSIEGVTVTSDDLGEVTLDHIDESEVIRDTDADQGTPLRYAVVSEIKSPLKDNPTETVWENLFVELVPVPDESMTGRIYGKVSNLLKNDSDKSFWTVRYPEILIKAAQYQIEVFHRNTQGANDFLTAIVRDLRNLEGDLIESQMGSLNQMRDSFKFRGKGNAR